MALFARRNELQRAYDAVATDYAEHLGGELEDKPADRRLLESFALAMQGSGACLDVGCGPGHVTRYLHERGLDISGLDISAKMIKRARKLNPGIRFTRGDFRELEFRDNSFAGVVAFYSLIHLTPAELVPALLELHRVLEPGAALFLAFHTAAVDGELTRQHLGEWWGNRVDLDFYFYRPLHMIVNLERAGFKQVSSYSRGPYPEEAQTWRCYMLAEALPGIPPARRDRAPRLA